MDPVVVTIPRSSWQGGSDAPDQGWIEDARTRYTAQLKIAEESWEAIACAFAPPCGQTVTGAIDVADEEVRTEVTLTWLMGHLVKPAEALIRREGALMLEGP